MTSVITISTLRVNASKSTGSYHMTCEEKNEIYDSVGNYWFDSHFGTQREGSISGCLMMVATKHGKDAIYHATRYMVDLGFNVGSYALMQQEYDID